MTGPSRDVLTTPNYLSTLIKQTIHVLRLTHTTTSYLMVILLLATSFGLNEPSSGQYLQKKKKLKNAGAYGKKMEAQLYSLIVFIIITSF